MRVDDQFGEEHSDCTMLTSALGLKGTVTVMSCKYLWPNKFILYLLKVSFFFDNVSLSFNEKIIKEVHWQPQLISFLDAFIDIHCVST